MEKEKEKKLSEERKEKIRKDVKKLGGEVFFNCIKCNQDICQTNPACLKCAFNI